MLLELGFVMNLEKSMLTPAQDTIFLGFSLDSVTFTERLSQHASNFQGVPSTILSRQICSIHLMSSITRADGVCHSRGPTWPASHDKILALGGFPLAGSHAS